MTNEMQPMQPLRYNRACGHPNDAILYLLRIDGIVEVYCSGCYLEIMKKNFGLKPVDILPMEEFAKKYMGGHQ